MISVVIPIYNAEKYIKRCLESVMAQTYEDIEIILVNDGSIDSSYKLCEEISERDKRIRIINQENMGVSVARNQGLEDCKGEYVIFVDSDDYLKSNMIEVLYKNIRINEADYVICDYITVKEGLLIESEQVIDYGSYKDTEIKEIIRNMIGGGKLFSSVWRGIYKKDIIIDNHIEFKQMKFAEDMLFNFEYLLNCNKVTVIDDKLYFYVENSSSALNRTKLDILETGKIPYEMNKLLFRYKMIEEYKEEYFQEIILMIERVFNIDLNIKRFIYNMKKLREENIYSNMPAGVQNNSIKFFIEKKWIELYIYLWAKKIKSKIKNLL